MSGAGPRARAINVPDSDQIPVLGPAGNKARTGLDQRKLAVKLQRKAMTAAEKPDGGGCDTGVDLEMSGQLSPSPPLSQPPRNFKTARSILRQHNSGRNHHHGHQHHLLWHNLSLNASCSSDASSDSSQSRASTGRISWSSSGGAVIIKNKPGVLKGEKRRSYGKLENTERVALGPEEGIFVGKSDSLGLNKRCAWVTPNSDPGYASFHDEEWGVPVHDDKKLFELLSLSGALAELTWPVILCKRDLFRDVFLDFDPVAVSNLNEKKILALGSCALSLLSEQKLRAIIDNAHQICKVIDEFGSFDKYIWGFVNQNPIQNRFRYPRQVPVKTPKADFISKDLIKRGFRSVGATVVYSFMQAAGLTNDHLISCFRFEECVALSECLGKDCMEDDPGEEKQPNAVDVVKLEVEVAKGLDEISLCSDL